MVVLGVFYGFFKVFYGFFLGFGLVFLGFPWCSKIFSMVFLHLFLWFYLSQGLPFFLLRRLPLWWVLKGKKLILVWVFGARREKNILYLDLPKAEAKKVIKPFPERPKKKQTSQFTTS